MKKTAQDWSPSFRYTMGIVVFIGIAALLIYAREAVRMLVIAGFIAYLISPAVKFVMERTKATRIMAVNVVYFSALIVMIGVPSVLTPIFFDEIQLVGQDLLDLSNQINTFLSSPINIAGYVIHLEQLGASLSNFQGNLLTPLPEEMLALIESTSINALWILVILTSVHLYMTEWPKISKWLIELAPEPYQGEVKELYDRLRNVWVAYLRGQIVLMLVVGVVFTIAWLVIGIPGALVLGMIAGLFTLVPDVGPLIAAALAVGVALLEGSTWIPLSNFWVAGITATAYFVLISLKNFFVRPIIMGRSLHMNEGLVFIAIIIATILGGIMGALLIVPVLASVAVIMEYLRRRILGLSPFEDGLGEQFRLPPEKYKEKKIKPPKKDKRKS